MSKLINQGGFGCIFYPAIECDGKISNNPKYASKLIKKDKRATHEYNIGKMVKQIELYEYYYAPVVNMCSIDLAKIDKREKDMCRIIKKGSSNSDDNGEFAIMKLSYIKNVDMVKYLTRSGVEKKELITYILDSYQFLLNNLKTLNDSGIIHFDFKIPNILIEDKTKTPIIIDFGLSIPVADIRPETYKTYFYSYSPKYYIWPVDVHVINYLVNMKSTLTKDALEELINIYVSTNTALRIFSDNFVDRFTKLTYDVYSKYIGVSANIVIKELTKNCKTWDNYALSVMFLNLINFISSDGFTDNKLMIDFSMTLLLNIHPDGRKRLTFDETKKRYNKIFSVNETVTGYKKLLDNFNHKIFNDKTIRETMQQEKLTPVEVVKKL
jgi:serine/threonine protein kinase